MSNDRNAMRRTRPKTALALLALFLFSVSDRIHALDPTSYISQYGHSVWHLQDGYFRGFPHALAQTTNGYIWLGTDAGLFRFDGVRFVRWSPLSGEELPSSRIFCLLGARDGSLWIGTDGGLARLVNHHLVLYQKGEGWLIDSLLEDRNGRIWFTHIRSDDRTHPLCQILDSEVRCYGSKEGVEAVGGDSLAQDASGDLWMGAPTTIVRWRPGASTVYRPQSLKGIENQDGIDALAPAADGSLWVGFARASRGAGLQRMVNGTLKPFLGPKLNGESLEVLDLHLDRQNSLWVGTSSGLYVIRGTEVDHFGSAEGLSSDYIWRIIEDHEGDVWVATSQGLDMFRDLPAKSISRREGLNQDGVDSVAASQDGSLWIGTTRLQLLGPQGISLFPEKALPGDQVTSLFSDRAGRLWAGMNNRLFVKEHGIFRQITNPDGSAVGMVMGITEDSQHTIWIESAEPPGKLLRIEDLKVHQEFPPPEVPLARKIVADPENGIWLGLVTGDLARFRNGEVDTFTFANHPNSRVLAMTAGPDGSILGATGFGVIGWKNGKQQVLTEQNGLPCKSVTALIFDDARNLWLYAECGLLEIPSEQMKLWWEHPESKLNPRLFDALDGVQPGLGHFNTSAKTPDGRLWFANGNVVQTIDPAHILGNTIPPPVHITALVADRKTHPLESGLRLPRLTRDLEIDYTALSYVAPQKVLFRYMLEGHDSRWQEAGTRREAFYNDLRPGTYRFHVIACNNDGVWNEAGASLEFAVLPAYYQTRWFRTLCAAAFLGLLWMLYRLRVHQLQRQFNIGLDARVNERTRIARELHDTLLQNFHGLMFQFQAVRNMMLKKPDEAMRSLDDVILETEKALAESRDAIHGLRSDPVAMGSLAELLVVTSKELATSGGANQAPPVFELTEEGERQALSPTTKNEVCRIAVEILRNAFRHAQAHRIEAEIRYGNQTFRLRIRDDGIGIDPKVLKEGVGFGHWGLRGIRERAERVGAQLDLWSEAGAGTEVQLAVPAAVAYETSPDGFGFKLFRSTKS